MFGISFPEILVILVVALVVVGPEQLPKVARTMGMLWARAQRYVNGIKADIARDMAADEFREMQQKAQEEARKAEVALLQGAKTVNQAVEQQVHEINSAAAQPLSGPSGADQAPPKQ